MLSGCSKEPKTEVIIQKVPVLKASSLYKPEMVYDYREAHGDFHEEMATSYLAKAKEAEATNLQKAIYFTKRAITLQPTLDYYKQLAALLHKTEQYDELMSLYELLVFDQADKTTKKDTPMYIFGKPDEELVYEFLVVNLLVNSYHTGQIVEEAKKQGVSLENLKKRLLADQRLQFTPTSSGYQQVLFYFFTEKGKEAYIRSEANFKQLLASIQDSSSSFEIGQKDVPQFNYEKFYQDDYADFSSPHFFMYFLPEKKEKPDEWVVFDLKRKVKISPEVNAIVYAIDSSELGCPEEMRDLYYRLVTYGKKGEVLQSMIVARQSGESLSTLSYDKGKFTVTDHKRTWKKPYAKNDFDNYLVKTEKTGEHRFEIQPTGKIIPVVAPSPETPDSTSNHSISPE